MECWIAGVLSSRRPAYPFAITPTLHNSNTPFFRMAKTAWIERNKRKAATVKQYAAIRAELRAKRDYAGLAKLPRNASPTRVVNRCSMSGRRHGYLRKFACSRLTFREAALNGLIPGVTKASW